MQNHTSLGTNVLLQFRPAYYDFLSHNKSNIPGSALSMFDAHILWEERQNRLSLNKLDLINIQTLGLLSTQLPYDTQDLWGLRLGYEMNRLNCYDCGVIHATGQYGYSYSFNKSVFFGAIEGKLTALDNDNNYVRIQPKIGTLFEVSEAIKTYAEIGLRQEVDHTQKSDFISNVSMRFGTNENYDFRLSLQTEASDALISLEHSLYW